MRIFEIILIATALAMDAFAVSITCGLSRNKLKISHILKVALFFGIFQGVMPVIGFYTGELLPFDITAYDHWIAFILLSIIGFHMIRESNEESENCNIKDLFNTKNLIIAAVATSIDALAAGFSVSLLDAGIALLAITSSLITFVFSFIGVKLGKKFGHYIEHRAELISGIVLILIGLKILLEHTL